MDFLAMKNEQRNALIAELTPVIAKRDAKSAELDAFASTLDTESRTADAAENDLVTLAFDELRSLNADVDARQGAIDVLDVEIADLEKIKQRRDNVPAQVRGSGSTDINDAYDIELRTAPRTAEVRSDIAERAKRVLADERNGLNDDQRGHIDGMLRSSKINRDGALERHLIATGRPAYRSAFAKLMRDDKVFTEAEGAALEEMRAINITTDADGGYLMPFTLDPTIVLVNDGRTNPMRQLATVRTVATDNWQGVHTAGVTASWDGESTEVSDDSPTFTQPSLAQKKMQAFVEFTVEAEQDFGSLVSDNTTMINDAFDELEASGFATGAGSATVPQGLITGLLANGPSIVATASAGTYVLADLDALSDAVPDRYDARAAFLMHRKIVTATRGLAPTDDPVRHLDSGGPMVIRSRPAYKYSKMDSTVAAGSEIAVCGDIAATYRIHDRIGTTIERIPHMFDTANNRPNGNRGWFAYKRVGAGVVNPSASRVLQVTT